jgi:hypothetical protein
MKNFITTIAVLLSLAFSFSVYAEPARTLTISGAVNNPLTLHVKDLDQFKPVDVQLNEITSQKDYNGAFVFHGAALKTLLDVADIEKKDTVFKKPVDLAVVIKNQAGEQIALSWGEIYYKNPHNIVIATSADPIFPHKGVDHFSDPDAYHQMIRTLNRQIGFPKLVITSDFYTDRCIENITEIIVVDLRPDVLDKNTSSLYAEKFQVTGAVKNPLTVEKLGNQALRISIRTHVLGEGRGYHGTRNFSGVPLKTFFDASSLQLGLNTVFLLSAPDAYSVLLSYGELFLNPHGARIIVADTCSDAPIEKNGKFILVLPDDLMADRELKAIRKIEIINIPK